VLIVFSHVLGSQRAEVADCGRQVLHVVDLTFLRHIIWLSKLLSKVLPVIEKAIERLSDVTDYLEHLACELSL